MRYFMRLSYNGTGFSGWQVQPREITVQGVLEDALSKVLRHPTGITGAGRTDTGVNARMMVAHFDHNGELPPSIVRSLNAMVGRNIAVEKIVRVADDAHARFDAVQRTYHYYACTRKSPFIYPLTWQASPSLDFEAMNTAAERLIGRKDFTSFSKLHTQVKTNICDLRAARWDQCGPDIWCFTITADRFLRNMVRAVVGTLVEVGRGKLTPDGITRIIEKKDRCSAGTSMPAQALYLWDIRYPYLYDSDLIDF
ncbi:MAG: tRNA pseudouridine(38-40) synthase TruA [Muribaculaceae bacterium]|nr:tRNA pseudouridine(38-40) synthase TruA [Muribaculaceae bacterium]